MPIAKKRPEKSSKKEKDVKASGKTNLKEDPTSSSISLEETPTDLLRKEGIVATYALDNKIIHRNVRDISVSNLTVAYHGTPLIEDAELTLNYGNRYGFIGRNGCGKSTFMRVVGARCFPIPDGIDIFHLKEEIEATEMTAKEAVMSVDVERAKLETEVEYLNGILTEEDHPDNNEDSMERLTQLYERLEQLDAATAEVRASKILSGKKTVQA
jgi:ATP-binding cassette subfamily F protein 2